MLYWTCGCARVHVHTCTCTIRGNELGDRLLSGDWGSVSSVLVCWSLDLGSSPDRSLTYSFPLDFFGQCKSTSKIHTRKLLCVSSGYYWGTVYLVVRCRNVMEV